MAPAQSLRAVTKLPQAILRPRKPTALPKVMGQRVRAIPGCRAAAIRLRAGRPQWTISCARAATGAAAVAAYALPLKLNIVVAIAAAVMLCLTVERVRGVK